MRHIVQAAITWALTSLIFLSIAHGQTRYQFEGPSLESPEPQQPTEEVTRKGPSRYADVTPAVESKAVTPSAKDIRPLVFVYSGDIRTCAPCRAAKAWIEANGATSGVRFEFRPIPNWVQATPTFHWQDSRSATGWTYQEGWSGPQELLRKIPKRVYASSRNEFREDDR
jgi:hypothetical protein